MFALSALLWRARASNQGRFIHLGLGTHFVFKSDKIKCSPVTSASPEFESHAGFGGNAGPLVLPSLSLFPLEFQALLQFVLGERQPLLQDRNCLRWEEEKGEKE